MCSSRITRYAEVMPDRTISSGLYHAGVIAWWLERKCQVQPLLRRASFFDTVTVLLLLALDCGLPTGRFGTVEFLPP